MDANDPISRREFLDCTGKIVFAAAAAGMLSEARGAGAETGKARCDSYCGIYCGACPNMIESEAAKEPGQVKCLGCKSGKRAGWCSKCKIRKCAEEQGVADCSECPEYPCDKQEAHQGNGKAYRVLVGKNLDRIEDKGVETWLKEQKKRWMCPKCGLRFSWQDETCKKCGATLYSAKKEAEAWKKQ